MKYTIAGFFFSLALLTTGACMVEFYHLSTLGVALMAPGAIGALFTGIVTIALAMDRR